MLLPELETRVAGMDSKALAKPSTASLSLPAIDSAYSLICNAAVMEFPRDNDPDSMV